MVTGGNRLAGEVAVGGAKNSVLKLMAATLLAEGTSTITNCPDILDVPLMAEVLRGLGATVELDGGSLDIAWREDGHVIMTGPAALSFEGVVDLEHLVAG